MLNLRRGRVASVAEAGTRIVRLTVTLEGSGESRDAIAYPGLTGPVEEGDDVVLNVEAQDLELGSGGFDIVHCNLTRGLAGVTRDAHVMKLNYTSLQHAVNPIEEGLEQAPERADLPVAVLALHGQLPCVAFAVAHVRPGTRVGFVQTAGGALPAGLSDTVADLLHRGLLAGHVTAGTCHGASEEAITVEGALDAAVRRLAWDCAIAGPGPGMLGSNSSLGHGGLAALSNSHAALSLGCRVVLVPRMSSGDTEFGLPEEGARLLGAAQGIAAFLSAPMFPRDRPVRDRCVAALTAALGLNRLAAALAAVRTLTLEAAIAEAQAVAAAVMASP